MQSESVPVKQGFNFYRKAWHMLGLVFPFAFYLDAFQFLDPFLVEGSRVTGIIVLFSGLLAVLILDLARFKNPHFNEFFFRYAGVLMKAQEKKQFNATVPYIMANLILFLFFRYELVILGGVFLMLGDPAAAWAGSHFGKHRFYNGKSLEGVVGFLIVSTIGALLFLLFHTLAMGQSDSYALLSPQGDWRFWMILWVLSGSFLAAMGEFFSHNAWMGILDDNLIVPLAGVAGMLLVSGMIPGVNTSELFHNPFELFSQLIQGRGGL